MQPGDLIRPYFSRLRVLKFDDAFDVSREQTWEIESVIPTEQAGLGFLLYISGPLNSWLTSDKKKPSVTDFDDCWCLALFNNHIYRVWWAEIEPIDFGPNESG